MTDTLEIEINRIESSRLNDVDFENLQFGKVFTDHMLMCQYTNGEWSAPKIMPYGNIPLSPASSMIHYGQSIFEGLKAFRTEANVVVVFRPEKNWARFNASATRLCMPEIPKEIFVEGLRQLINLDRAWVPNSSDSSLYIRPFMFATDALLGVKPSETYMFMIILAPVGPYYPKPLHLKIETHYTRAAMGGVGAAKAAGNYASALYPAKLAQEQCIDQLIWTDAKEHKYLEEAGTMNMMLVIGDTLITPPLTATILPGVTRDSFLTLAREAGVNVEERRISTDEVVEAAKAGTLREVFGVGTAATIANVVKITFEDKTFELPAIETRKISPAIGEKLLRIKKGQEEDTHGWNITI